jgi:hypothetical protein
VINASAIPADSSDAWPAPDTVMVWKTWIMPVTVPSRPSSGEMPTIVPSVPR